MTYHSSSKMRGPNVLLLIIVICCNSVQGQGNTSGPKFVNEPPGLVEYMNTKGTSIDCTASGQPSPSTVWVTVDNTPVVNISGIRFIQSNGTLVLHPYRSEQYRPDVHAAAYRCWATNTVGTISSQEVQLHAVLEKSYDVHVYDTYVIEGNTAIFKCHVPAVISEYVQVVAWIKNDNLLIQSKELEGSTDKYAIMPAGELHIRDVSSADANSKYKCKTTHRLSGETQISSSTGQLFVAESKSMVAPRISDSISSLSFKQGQTAVLPCVAQGRPAPSLKWHVKTRAGHLKDLPQDSRYVQTKSTLIISDVAPSDEATYICEVSNELGKEYMDLDLSVVGSFNVTLIPAIRTPKIGEEVRFDCEFTSKSPASIQWLHNGVSLSNQLASTLTIPNVDISDQGMYQCLVKSAFQVIQASSELRISEIAPHWTETFKEIVEHPGNPVSAQCTAAGIPLPVISWRLDGTPIYSNDNLIITSTTDKDGRAKSSLQLISATTEDGGTYTCSARNGIAEILYSARINVYGPLHIRNVPTQIAVSGQDVNLDCPIYGYPWKSIQWEKDEVQLPAEIRHKMAANGSLVIQNVHRSVDNGRFTCKVESNDGQVISGFVELQVMVPPRIVPFEFQDELLREGMRARLQCVVSDGDVPLNVTWLKDEKPISPSMGVLVRVLDEFSSILTIGSISPSHNGNYTCVAANRAATVTHTAELSVNVLPKIIPFDFLDDQFYKGMRAHVTCAISQGDLPVTFQWQKDGLAIAPELEVLTRKYDARTESLSIDNVSSKHSGNYTCVARNKAGRASHTAQLLVRVRPKIVPFPLKDEHYEGTPARLVCGLLEGDPPIHFVWLKDNLPVHGNESVSIHHIDGLSSILSIGRLTAKHAGNYSCLASNDAGSDTYSVTLKVNAPKIVPFSFQGDHVFEGALARLTCVVYQGDLPLTIHWQKDGITIPTNLGISVHSIDTYTSILTIDHVQSKHGGNYSCIAKNKAATSSHSAFLTVNVPPKIVPFAFQDEHLIEGMLARVSCVVSRGDLPLKLSWEKDGSALTSGPDGVQIRSFDDHSSILSIASVAPLNDGQYTCIANNQAGSTRHSAQLVVKVPPRWILKPKATTVVNGRSTLLHCQADGFPKPNIAWLHGKSLNYDDKLSNLKNSADIHIYNNGSLLIRRTTAERSGYYLCKVSNGIGIGLSQIATVKVYIPPSFENKNQTIHAQKGKSKQIICKGKADTPLNVTWYKDNKKMNNDSNGYRIFTSIANLEFSSEVRIKNVSRDDNGTYSCIATNAHGLDKSITTLLVIEHPDAPNVFEVTHFSSQEAGLKWSPPYDGNTPLQAYVIQYYQSEGNVSKMPVAVTRTVSVPGFQTAATVSGLNPATTYHFKIFAENKEGRSKSSTVVIVKTAEEAPTGAPLHVQVDSSNHETIKVSWKPPEEDKWNGRLQGYYVGFKEMASSEGYSFKTLLTADPTSGDLSVQIGGMKQHTKYSVVVQAYNNKGKGPLSEPVVVMTSEGAPRQPPNDIRCTTLTSQSIHVTWIAPSTESMNGILQGYKVVYRPSLEWFDDAPEYYNSTSTTAITLNELHKYTNYSVQVLAYTKSGEGPLSDAVFCKTLDDVPSPVMDMKAAAADETSIIVSWKPPENPNGILKSYTVSWRPAAKKQAPISHIITAQHNYYEISPLQQGQQYEFWITASTLAGDGKPSRVIVQSTSGPTVPAKIISFDDKVIAAWKTSITLTCFAVGRPEPIRKWTMNGQVLENGVRVKVLANGSLLVKEAEERDAGDYGCHIYNELGEDRIMYTVIILAPPPPPAMEITSTTSNSIDIQWNVASHKLSKVKGFTLHVRKETGDWTIIDLGAYVRRHKLDSLDCGTGYELYMTANNKIGIGMASEAFIVSTNGSVPLAPSKPDLIEETSSSVSLYLNTWKSNGCPILYYIVEYAPKHSKEWTFVSNNIKPEQRRLVIPGLMPGTWYSLRMTAHNSAGSAVAEYNFATLSKSGATISPDLMNQDNLKGIITYLNLYVTIPVSITVAILLAILGIACFYVKRKKVQERRNKGERFSTVSSDMQRGGNINSFAYMQRNTLNRNDHPSPLLDEDAQDDPTPYATGHLSSYPPPLPPPNMVLMAPAPSMSPQKFNGDRAEGLGMNSCFFPPPPSFVMGQGAMETSFIFPQLPEEDSTPFIKLQPTYTNDIKHDGCK